jgi:hypothetical protein
MAHWTLTVVKGTPTASVSGGMMCLDIPGLSQLELQVPESAALGFNLPRGNTVVFSYQISCSPLSACMDNQQHGYFDANLRSIGGSSVTLFTDTFPTSATLSKVTHSFSDSIDHLNIGARFTIGTMNLAVTVCIANVSAVRP